MPQKRDSGGRFTANPSKRREQERRRKSTGVHGTHYQKWMSKQATITTRVAVTGAMSAGGDLGAAAGIVAEKAREMASGWSRQIPPAIRVQVRGNVAEISCQVGPAYPNEIEGVRHPVFGPTPDNPDPDWVTNEHRPFLAPAADAGSDQAMARYAQKIDGWARKAGYT
jgi:hypothetical protein